ncbi:hypothetical protein HUU53_03685 [Candidatus Micrarchaeota archaeon]|nr:hypothetical protein [Candidatus Micrarchaeota archaeon]
MKKLFALLIVSLLFLGCTSTSQPTATPTIAATATIEATPQPTIAATPIPTTIVSVDCETPLSLKIGERTRMPNGNYLNLKSATSEINPKVSLQTETQARIPVVQFDLRAGESYKGTAFEYELQSFDGTNAIVCLIALPSPTPAPTVSPIEELKTFTDVVQQAASKHLKDVSFTLKQNTFNPALSTYVAAGYNNNYEFQIETKYSPFNSWSSKQAVMKTGLNGEQKEVYYVFSSSGSTGENYLVEIPCENWKYYITFTLKAYPQIQNPEFGIGDRLMSELISICPE